MNGIEGKSDFFVANTMSNPAELEYFSVMHALNHTTLS
jgi:hypothetical protein